VNPNIEKTLAVITFATWIAFFFVDRLWQQTLAEAVSRQEGTYGEMYGPVSFFRPAFFYSAAFLSLACAFLLFRRANSSHGHR
jgi:hypothetical protein